MIMGGCVGSRNRASHSAESSDEFNAGEEDVFMIMDGCVGLGNRAVLSRPLNSTQDV